MPSDAPPLALYTDVPTDRARAPRRERRSAPCYSFLGGRCTKGDKCSFSHESKDASGVPQCAFCKGYGHVKDKCNKYRNSRDKAAVDAQANLAAAEPPKEAAAAPSVVGLLSAAPQRSLGVEGQRSPEGRGESDPAREPDLAASPGRGVGGLRTDPEPTPRQLEVRSSSIYASASSCP